MNIEPIKILLVDDRPENLLTLEAIIGNDEYHLVKANSGNEALKCLLNEDFAAILLDVQMPGMDGFETAKIIKAREKTKNIPILFITANHLESEHIFKGYSVGAIDYILKPFDPLILKAKVEAFVELYKMKQKLIKQAKELTEKNKVIEHMAYHDSLTELPNRRHFYDQLIEKINDSRKLNQTLAMMYLDLDRFKYINDSLGHFVGDRLLQKVAQRLRANIREGDLVARVGGDEFNILLPKTDRENALEIIHRLLEAFKMPFIIDKYELFMTTCVGLSMFPYDGEDSQSLIKSADAALYRAKEGGKNNYYVFHTGMNIQSYRTFLMENDLRKSVERKQFTVLYQPIVEIETGRVTKAEALLRWNHPEWGLISPTEFIPIAEETGQIVEIGQWVLRKVCEQINEWQQKEIAPIPIAINFSSQQFLQKNLINEIEKALKEHDVKPELIEIEITESVILGNEEYISKTIKKLREMGLSISLDDFGTGYSSLNYLRKFPLDTLKIDKSFIGDLNKNAQDTQAIIEAITALAKNLKMKVIAEGVETTEQLSLISQYECQEFQGFLCSPPLYPHEFELFLTSQKETAFSRQKVDKKKEEPIPPISPIAIVSGENNHLKEEILKAALQRIKKQYSISSRELDVFELIISGLSNKEISEKLFISEHTVKNHITHILQKLNVSDRVQVIALVYEICIREGDQLLHS